MSFASGRFTTPTKIVTEIKTVEVIKVVKDTEVKKKKRTVIVVKPDGTKEVVIDETTDKQQKETTDKDKKTDSKTEKEKGSDHPTTISLLGGYSLQSSTPVFGLSLYRPVLGPIGIGIWVITPTNAPNPTIGGSIGLSF